MVAADLPPPPPSFELTAGTDGLVTLSNSSQQVSLFAEGRWRVAQLMQVGGSVAMRLQSSDSATTTAFQGFVGPTFNFVFDSDIPENQALQESFFLSPHLGFTTARSSFSSAVVAANTVFTVSLRAGKRFNLAFNIAYAPSMGIVKQWSFDPRFVIEPLAFSLFF